jgi:nitroreductase
MMKQKQLITLKRQQELIAINRILAILVVLLALFGGYLLALKQSWLMSQSEVYVSEEIETPVVLESSLLVAPPKSNPLVALLQQSRYVRSFEPKSSLSQYELGSLIWAAQGTITSWGERVVPSYKSTFPITLLLLVRNVDEMEPGWYVYDASDQVIRPDDLPLHQLVWPKEVAPLIDAPALLLATQSVQSSTPLEHAWLEAGGVAQNVLLMSTQLDLGTLMVPISSLPSDIALQLTDAGFRPLFIMPLGDAAN